MKHISRQVIYGLCLVLLSAIIYLIHFYIFSDAHHILLYLIGDIAFVPIQVLIVTLILERILTAREKKNMLKKMNMVIGTFFSEVGTELLRIIANTDKEVSKIGEHLVIDTKWTEKTFKNVVKIIQSFDYAVEITRDELVGLKDFIVKKREFMLRLLESPNLLEHESFTDLLWAVFHLIEELDSRYNIKAIDEKDLEHLSTDIHRVYKLLVYLWLTYMQHLQSDYPFLFAYAIRVNPFINLDEKMR